MQESRGRAAGLQGGLACCGRPAHVPPALQVPSKLVPALSPLSRTVPYRTVPPPQAVCICKSGFQDAVVWNPAEAKAASMGDLGAGHYRGFVCVEVAQARSGPVSARSGCPSLLPLAAPCLPHGCLAPSPALRALPAHLRLPALPLSLATARPQVSLRARGDTWEGSQTLRVEYAPKEREGSGQALPLTST